jgi:hypothetical protein
MIGNYTHKELECAQKTLKNQGHINRIFEEMKASCPPRPKPVASGKKMQPPNNTRSEPVETLKKGKSSKTTVTTEGTSKTVKATEVLAQWKT